MNTRDASTVNTVAPYVLTALMTKPARLVHLSSFASRWEGTTSHAVDPGWVPTRMGGAGAPDDLTEGHRTQVWLATHDDVTPRTGGYWYHRRTQTPHPAARDEEFQARLIRFMEGHTGVPLD
jgi:NAD(P)-dependent dehydrogenase (short-subunit alcohol dehydrogenase family)